MKKYTEIMQTTNSNQKDLLDNEEVPWSIINSYFDHKHLKQLVKHQIESYNYFMIAIFPTSQARILDYNRLIKDLYGYSHGDFIKEIKKKFKVEKQNSSYKPKKSQVFGMYLEKQWYSLELKEKPHQNLFHIVNACFFGKYS